MIKILYFVGVGLAASVFAFGFSFVVGVLMFGHKTFGISYYGVLDFYPLAAVISGVVVAMVVYYFGVGIGVNGSKPVEPITPQLFSRSSAYLTGSFTLWLYVIIEAYLANIDRYPIREGIYFLVGRGIWFVPFSVLTGLCFFAGLVITSLGLKYLWRGTH